MKNRKFRVIPFLPLVLYLLVYLYGYSGIEPEPGVAYGYLYLFLFLVPCCHCLFCTCCYEFCNTDGGSYLFIQRTAARASLSALLFYLFLFDFVLRS